MLSHVAYDFISTYPSCQLVQGCSLWKLIALRWPVDGSLTKISSLTEECLMVPPLKLSHRGMSDGFPLKAIFKSLRVSVLRTRCCCSKLCREAIFSDRDLGQRVAWFDPCRKRSPLKGRCCLGGRVRKHHAQRPSRIRLATLKCSVACSHTMHATAFRI